MPIKLEIRKKNGNVWEYVRLDEDDIVGSSKQHLTTIDDNSDKSVIFTQPYGNNFAEYKLDEVAVYDDSVGGSIEVFTDLPEFQNRLKTLGNPSFYSDADLVIADLISSDASNAIILGADGKLYANSSGGGGGSVFSVFGRQGTVIAQSGDYSMSQITDGIPSGGLENQILKKSSDTDYDYEWGANVPSISTDEDNAAEIGTDGGLFVPETSGNIGIESLLAGTPNVSISDGATTTEKVISVTQTTAGLLSNVYFTADDVTTSEGTFYKTLINDKGLTPQPLTSNTITLDDDEQGAFPVQFIGDPSPINNPIVEGVYAAFPVIEVNSNQASQRIKIEAYVCDSDGVPLNGGGQVGFLGVETVLIADSGVIDIQQGNPTSINCQGFVDFTQNPNTIREVLIGQRFRYVVIAEKVGSGGSLIDFTLLSGSDYNSYYQIPTISITTGFDPNAIHKDVPNEFDLITEVTEPNNDSFLLIEDELGDKKKVKVGSLVGDATLTKDVNQVGHGFSVGNVIRLDGSNYVKAQADSVNNANAISFVVSVTDADNFVLQSEGYTSASLGLSNGDEAFLSTTVLGGIQTTEPTNGEINLYLGQQTPQGFLISISTGFVVGGGSSGSAELEYQPEITSSTTLTTQKGLNKVYPVNSSSDVVITIPSGYSENDVINFERRGQGTVEFVGVNDNVRLRGVRDVENRYFINDLFSWVSLTCRGSDEFSVIGRLKNGYSGAVNTSNYTQLTTSATSQDVTVTGTGFSNNMLVALIGNATLNSFTVNDQFECVLNITPSGSSGDLITIEYDNGNDFTDTNAIELTESVSYDTEDLRVYYRLTSDANDYQINLINGSESNVTFGSNGGFFNGTSSQIDIPDNNALSFGNGSTDNDLSFSFTITPNDFTTRTILMKRGGANNNEYQIELINGGLSPNAIRVLFFSQNTNNNLIEKRYSNLTSSNTYHCVITKTGLTVKLYINKVEVLLTDFNSGTYIAMNNTTSETFIGAKSYSPFDTVFNGNIKRVGLWDVVLSQSNINDLYDVEIINNQDAL